MMLMLGIFTTKTEMKKAKLMSLKSVPCFWLMQFRGLNGTLKQIPCSMSLYMMKMIMMMTKL